MDPIENLGILSLIPASVAILLAFITRNTISTRIFRKKKNDI